MSALSSPRVVDFSTHLSGPLASHYLAEMGADVVKVEHWRVGDGNRGVAPFIQGTGMIHVNCGPGIRSLAADTKSPHWGELVEACCRWADVVIVGARPVDAAQRGLDFDSVRKHNPTIVYCSISGYGEAGPWRDRPAHGQQMDAYAGNVPVEWVDGQPRTPRGFRTAGTTAAAMFAAMGVSAALFRRTRISSAYFVDVSGWGAAMSWQWRDATTYANSGQMWTEYTDAGSRYGMYATADGRALLLCPLERKYWEAFCDLADLPGIRERGDWSVNGMDWGTGPDYADERVLIESRIRTRTLDDWTAELTSTGIPFAPVLTHAEALTSDHAQASGILGETTVDGRQAWFTRSAVRISSPTDDKSPTTLSPPPRIGEHTAEILEEIGLSRLIDLAPALRTDGGSS